MMETFALLFLHSNTTLKLKVIHSKIHTNARLGNLLAFYFFTFYICTELLIVSSDKVTNKNTLLSQLSIKVCTGRIPYFR